MYMYMFKLVFWQVCIFLRIKEADWLYFGKQTIRRLSDDSLLIFFEGISWQWISFCKYLWTFETYRWNRKKRLINENCLSREGKLRWSMLLNPFYMEIFPTCSNHKMMLKGCHPHRHITCGLLFLYVTLLMWPYRAQLELKTRICVHPHFCTKAFTTHDKVSAFRVHTHFQRLVSHQLQK